MTVLDLSINHILDISRRVGSYLFTVNSFVQAPWFVSMVFLVLVYLETHYLER